MKLLKKPDINQIEKELIKYARPLELAIFNHLFKEKNLKLILDELKKFQNSDGGFGNGLEPDFRMPNSSPLATSIALQLIYDYDLDSLDASIVSSAIRYLEFSFSEKRKGWYSVDKSVNDYPHTPWWEWNLKERQTLIDHYWGNPNAKLIGDLKNYERHVAKLNVDKLVKFAEEYFLSLDKFESFHEIFCFTRFAQLVNNLSESFCQRLKDAVSSLVVLDKDKWLSSDYVARPLDFLVSDEETYGIPKKTIDLNLDILIDQLVVDKHIAPHWPRKFYHQPLEDAWNEWYGILTIKALVSLKRFKRIE